MTHYKSRDDLNVEVLKEVLGQAIKDISLIDDQIVIRFDNEKVISIRDTAQFCCEHRHMTCDDDLKSLVGQTLDRVELKEGPAIEKEYDVHATMFLEIGSNKGFITVVNHNEHNGYYGGFSIAIEQLNEG
jgi:hypothetical protein